MVKVERFAKLDDIWSYVDYKNKKYGNKSWRYHKIPQSFFKKELPILKDNLGKWVKLKTIEVKYKKKRK